MGPDPGASYEIDLAKVSADTLRGAPSPTWTTDCLAPGMTRIGATTTPDRLPATSAQVTSTIGDDRAKESGPMQSRLRQADRIWGPSAESWHRGVGRQNPSAGSLATAPEPPDTGPTRSAI